MTQNDGKKHMNEKIKAIGRQAGFAFIGDGVYGQRWYASECGMDASEFEKFAELITQHEREACAKVCETLWDTSTNGMATEEQSYGNECAKVIRARGQA